MRKAIVDAKGHLRLAYWNGNELAKGKSIAVDTAQSLVVYPPGHTAANPIVKLEAAGDGLSVQTDKNWGQFPWLESNKTRKAVVVLNQRFDLDAGLIVEGQINAKILRRGPYGDTRQTHAGFYIEGVEKNTGTGILLDVGEPQWRESRIGKVRMGLGFDFDTLDATGRGSATVTGLDDGRDHTFRLWLRGGQMELYIDDLLMQSFFYFKATGRIGFISQESDVKFSKLRFYSMSL
jgi:hypothetical protein